MFASPNVSKTFAALSKGQQSLLKALDSVSFSIAAGQCVARLGASGSGKSTVVGMAGAGGIGVILYEVIRSFQYAQICAALISLIGSVTIIDVISAYLRKQVT